MRQRPAVAAAALGPGSRAVCATSIRTPGNCSSAWSGSSSAAYSSCASTMSSRSSACANACCAISAGCSTPPASSAASCSMRRPNRRLPPPRRVPRRRGERDQLRHPGARRQTGQRARPRSPRAARAGGDPQLRTRLRRDSVRVRAVLEAERMQQNTLTFEIEAELWGGTAPQVAAPHDHRSRRRQRHRLREGGLMDRRFLRYYEDELQHLRCRRRVRQDPQRDRRQARARCVRLPDPYASSGCSKASLFGGARATEARCRVPALHRPSAGAVVPGLSRADALDGARPPATRLAGGLAGRRLRRAARHPSAQQPGAAYPKSLYFQHCPRRLRCGRSRSRRCVTSPAPRLRSATCRAARKSRRRCRSA